MKHTLFIAAALLASTGASYAAGARICFEAEKPASMTKPFHPVKVTDTKDKVSGTGYLEIPWDRNKTKGEGQANYTVKVTTPGVYTVWARAYWANGCGNSIGVSVNGGPMAVLGEDGTYDSWHWVGGRFKVALKAGNNTLVFKNHETGPRVDQFFLCQDASYEPTGIRKITQ